MPAIPAPIIQTSALRFSWRLELPGILVVAAHIDPSTGGNMDLLESFMNIPPRVGSKTRAIEGVMMTDLL